MSKENFHNEPFDEGTKLKLEIYRLYIREWLPVFLNNKQCQKVKIFDFFAGSGTDSVGTPGSPLIALEEISSALDCNKKRLNALLKIELYLNDSSSEKMKKLKILMEEKIKESIHFELLNKHFSFKIKEKEFKDIFPIWLKEMQMRSANFVFLDQFGIKDVSLNIVFDLAKIQYTDIMFFSATSIINRMKEHPDILDKVPFLTSDDRKNINGKNVCHVLAQIYSRELFKKSKTQFFVWNYAIRKGSNVNGLIFITKHPAGIDKFLHITWDKDILDGSANFDVNNDGIIPEQGVLPMPIFHDMNVPKRIKIFKNNLRNAILQKQLSTNHEIYIVSLLEGMLPKYAKEVLKELKEEGKIKKVLAISSHKILKKMPETLSY